MWAKIEIVPSERKVIYLPPLLYSSFMNHTNILFGTKTVRTRVECSDSLWDEEGTFERPIKILLTSKLRDRLHIPETLIYQIRIYENRLSIGPVIGMMLGIHSHLYNPKHMEKYSDRFGIYNKVGGLICAFSAKSIDWKRQVVFGLFYDIESSSWKYGSFPLPNIVYRRDFHCSSRIVKKIINLTNGRTFNSYRFSKHELYSFASKDSKLSRHIPPTELSSDFNQVKGFIDKHLKVILKPNDLSRGRGICIIEKRDSGYIITDYRFKFTVESTLRDEESLTRYFDINKSFFNKYLIQKYIPLAGIDGSFFDIRVVMQKNGQGIWGCTGIECRVSGKSCHLTNISRGGYALSLDEALRSAFPEDCDYELLKSRIDRFCMRFCKHMDTFGAHFAEFGMDVAFDTGKNLWFIEANVFPSFKGFKKMDYDTYLAIRHTPFLYALYLSEFKD